MTQHICKKNRAFFQNSRENGILGRKAEKNKEISGEIEDIPGLHEHLHMRDRLL